ncbi:hypothetical protein ABT408_36870, partial [Streptomyces halstedii]
MNHNTPLSPRPLRHLSHVQRRVLTTTQLRSHGVTAAETNEQCRAGGAWQQTSSPLSNGPSGRTARATAS